MQHELQPCLPGVQPGLVQTWGVVQIDVAHHLGVGSVRVDWQDTQLVRRASALLFAAENQNDDGRLLARGPRGPESENEKENGPVQSRGHILARAREKEHVPVGPGRRRGHNHGLRLE